MATSAITNIDFSPLSCTPSTSKHDVQTPKSTIIHQEPSIGSVPHRGRLLGTLKALRPRSRSRTGDENEGHSSTSRKRFAWDIFGTLRSRRGPENSSDNSNHFSRSRARTASPSKNESPDGK
ncbi:hypothetical protein BGZ60DRAFT_212653 [Tricladium varicosporioides]|nr:hypothetical protein BGZ60DRAFT_212653 [Hymenoscyphus varicosporioides]